MSDTTTRQSEQAASQPPDIVTKPTDLPGRKVVKQRLQRKDISSPTIDLGEITNLQVLDEHGELTQPSKEPKLDHPELLRIYRALVMTRKLDIRMLNMQRQGEMGTFAPGMGQEATQIGQVYPLRKTDWFSPSYRSFGSQLWRGWTIDQLMLLWAGYFEGFGIPEDVNDLPFSIVIGSHVAPATGIAMAIKKRRDDSVVVTNFGDGALSQGIVAESFNFASVYKAPIIYICENNGYAISVPVQKQAGAEFLASRGIGFGIPSLRVDGNDIFAMMVACEEAVNRARNGEGPTLIEAVTYRMSLHTTADDPKVYRDDSEVEVFKSRCPIARFEKYLKKKSALDDASIERIGTECEEEILTAREVFRKRAVANPREVFDFMFKDMPPELAAQQQEYFEKLDRKGVS